MSKTPKGLQRCIACHGKGFIPRPKNDKVKEHQKKEILRLYRKGVGYREIGRRVGVVHPQSVKHVILYANKK